MRASIRRLSGVVVGAVLVVGLTGTAAGAESADVGLRRAMTEVVRAGAAGVQVRVHNERGDWNGTAGVRELDGGTVPANGRFRAGSITKTFVATVVLQLVNEGAVALDDPVGEYLPRFGLDPRITVRMLLQHTSGLFNYTGETNQDGTLEPGIPLLGKEFEDNRFRTYQPEELIGLALSKPARFQPGTGWSYSNTGYVLIGQLIERLTGTPYADQVRHRILRPLRLRDTILPGAWSGMPGPHAHGYYAYRHQGQLRVLDVSRVNPTWAASAGEIITTTRDLDRFITALFGGELLPTDLLTQMRQTRPIGPGAGYGLGLLTLDAGPECGGVHYGHTGGMHGYLSYLYTTADGGKRVEISVTSGAIEDDDPQAAQRIADAVNNVRVAALCGTTQSADLPKLHDQLAMI